MKRRGRRRRIRLATDAGSACGRAVEIACRSPVGPDQWRRKMERRSRQRRQSRAPNDACSCLEVPSAWLLRACLCVHGWGVEKWEFKIVMRRSQLDRGKMVWRGSGAGGQSARTCLMNACDCLAGGSAGGTACIYEQWPNRTFLRLSERRLEKCPVSCVPSEHSCERTFILLRSLPRSCLRIPIPTHRVSSEHASSSLRLLLLMRTSMRDTVLGLVRLYFIISTCDARVVLVSHQPTTRWGRWF